MTLGELLAHTGRLATTLLTLRDPLPADAISLFNRLLDEAQASRNKRSFVQEIPRQGPDARRADLLLWLPQIEIALRPNSD
jgi:hypothetical protein